MRGRLSGVLRLLAGAGISISPTWGGEEVTVTNAKPGHVIQDEGVDLTQRSKLNFTGTGVTASDDAANDRTVVTIAQGGGHTILDEGTALPQRSKLDFQGAGVTATDDAANDKTIVTIPGGGSGGGGVGGGVAWKTRNLIVENDSTAPASKVKITADEITIEDVILSGVNVTADITASGANGLDTGTEAASTWYAIWLIYNPTTSTVASLLSTSFISPTMPTGYTKKRRVGAVYNKANSNFRTFTQLGERTTYVDGGLGDTENETIILNGGNSVTFVTLNAGPFVPPSSRALIAFVVMDPNDGIRVRPTGTTGNGYTIANRATNLILAWIKSGEVLILLNSSRQFDYRVIESSAHRAYISAYGYLDPVS